MTTTLGDTFAATSTNAWLSCRARSNVPVASRPRTGQPTSHNTEIIKRQSPGGNFSRLGLLRINRFIGKLEPRATRLVVRRNIDPVGPVRQRFPVHL